MSPITLKKSGFLIDGFRESGPPLNMTLEAARELLRQAVLSADEAFAVDDFKTMITDGLLLLGYAKPKMGNRINVGEKFDMRFIVENTSHEHEKIRFKNIKLVPRVALAANPVSLEEVEFDIPGGILDHGQTSDALVVPYIATEDIVTRPPFEPVAEAYVKADLDVHYFFTGMLTKEFTFRGNILGSRTPCPNPDCPNPNRDADPSWEFCPYCNWPLPED